MANGMIMGDCLQNDNFHFFKLLYYFISHNFIQSFIGAINFSIAPFFCTKTTIAFFNA